MTTMAKSEGSKVQNVKSKQDTSAKGVLDVGGRTTREFTGA